MNFISLLLVISMSLPAFAILNVESIRYKKGKDGKISELGISANKKDGNTRTANINLDFSFKTSSEINEHLLILTSSYGKSNDLENVNNSLLHYRYGWNIQNPISYESFLQFNKNEFTRLKLRSLAGIGIRWQLANTDTFRSYFGLGIMAENKKEIVNNIDETESKEKANLYFSFKYQIEKAIKLEWVNYYQPSIEDYKDYNYFHVLALNLEVNDFLSVNLEYSLSYDSTPVAGVEYSDHSYGTKFKFNF